MMRNIYISIIKEHIKSMQRPCKIHRPSTITDYVNHVNYVNNVDNVDYVEYATNIIMVSE